MRQLVPEVYDPACMGDGCECRRCNASERSNGFSDDDEIRVLPKIE
jgi:hypothetical protein